MPKVMMVVSRVVCKLNLTSLTFLFLIQTRNQVDKSVVVKVSSKLRKQRKLQLIVKLVLRELVGKLNCVLNI